MLWLIFAMFIIFCGVCSNVRNKTYVIIVAFVHYVSVRGDFNGLTRQQFPPRPKVVSIRTLIWSPPSPPLEPPLSALLTECWSAPRPAVTARRANYCVACSENCVKYLTNSVNLAAVDRLMNTSLHHLTLADNSIVMNLSVGLYANISQKPRAQTSVPGGLA